MNQENSTRPTLLLVIFRFFAVIGFLPFLLNTVDILLNPSALSLTPETDPIYRLLLGVFAALLTLAIAVLCIRRSPSNLVGWLLVLFAYGDSVQVVRFDLLPVNWAVILFNMVISLFWFAFIFIPIYFPDGQLFPPKISRWGNAFLILFMVFSIVASTICNPKYTWGNGEHQIKVSNPLYLLDFDIRIITIPVASLLLIGGVVSLIFRYRKGDNLERLQLRWLIFGTAFQLILTIMATQFSNLTANIQNWVGVFYGLIIPLAVGVAVLRYRLYDIDLIIRRTLQYGLITVLLGLIYYGLIILLEQVFRSVSGQDSAFAIVISTLVIAALFNPVRRRVQTGIDRRFFRARYDAEKALSRFSTAVRSQVELDLLAGKLAATAQEALEPEGVWVWLNKRGQNAR